MDCFYSRCISKQSFLANALIIFFSMHKQCKNKSTIYKKIEKCYEGKEPTNKKPAVPIKWKPQKQGLKGCETKKNKPKIISTRIVCDCLACIKIGTHVKLKRQADQKKQCIKPKTATTTCFTKCWAHWATTSLITAWTISTQRVLRFLKPWK